MPTGPWQRPKFDQRDYHPHQPAEEHLDASWRERRASRERFTNGAEGDGAIQTVRYVRAAGNGQHIVEFPGDKSRQIRLPSAQGADAFNPGQRVMVGTTRQGMSILGNPPGAEKGLSESPIVVLGGSVDVLGIISASPSSIPAGGTTTVTITGYGFQSDDVWTAVIYNTSTLVWDTDPDVTVGTMSYTSATEVDLDLTPDAGFDITRKITLQAVRA